MHGLTRSEWKTDAEPRRASSGIEFFRLAVGAVSGAFQVKRVVTSCTISLSFPDLQHSVHLDTKKCVLPAWQLSLGRVICRYLLGWFSACSTYDLLEDDITLFVGSMVMKLSDRLL